MLWLHQLRKIYSLDTLDTRLAVSSTTPPKDVGTGTAVETVKLTPSGRNDIDGQQSTTAQKPCDDAQPSKWRTTEYYVYYIVFIICVPLMFKTVIQVSLESHPEYPKYSHLLSDGWILGRKVDNSDSQYSSFRDNIPYLLVALVIHHFLRRAYDYLTRADAYQPKRSTSASNSKLTQGLPSEVAADARLEQRVSYDFYFAIVFIVALHGVSSAKILLILYVNYSLALKLPKRYVPIATWVFNVAILFANELSRGYSFASVVSFLPSPASDQSKHVWAKQLDSYGGIVPRWEVLFKVTILRQISFNLDYYWSLNRRGGSPVEKKQLDASNLSERDRITISAKEADYSFRNYFAYALYSPLYLAGPIITFNDYISQQRHKSPSIQKERTILFGIRFLLALLCMEFFLHFIYVVAISKAQPDWNAYTPIQLSMLSWFNLKIVWLKLLVPWRFFRLWALIDGVDPPENMVRCMSNSYSPLAFWRGWHRSFNRWTIRYIYVPLGGSRGGGGGGGSLGKLRTVGNFLVVFTFVAMWHDINLELLIWGWLVVLFVVPELVATRAFPAARWRSSPTAYRWLCGIGAVGNMMLMMVANIVGFALGIDGLKGLLHGLVGSPSGIAFLGTAAFAMFVGVQVMFEIRQGELRRGVRMKC